MSPLDPIGSVFKAEFLFLFFFQIDFHCSLRPVNLWVSTPQPRKAQYHILGSQFRDEKHLPLGRLPNLKSESHEVGDLSGTIFGSVDVVEGELANERVRTNSISFYKPFTDEEGGSATIHHSHD
jgi:hypothetical protein